MIRLFLSGVGCNIYFEVVLRSPTIDLATDPADYLSTSNRNCKLGNYSVALELRILSRFNLRKYHDINLRTGRAVCKRVGMNKAYF